MVETANLTHEHDIITMMQSESNKLGFVPQPRVREEILRGRVLVALEAEETVGYILLSRQENPLKIIQCVVRREHRRRGIATELVEEARRRVGLFGQVQLRCREDLEAIHFWREIGFEEIGRCRGGTARRKQIIEWSSNAHESKKSP